MVPSQRPINLIEIADRCQQHLEGLKKYAYDSKTKHNSKEKKILLDDVVTRIKSNIQSLTAWTAAIAKGRQTKDEDIKASVKEVFENIISRTADALQGLKHRLDISMLRSNRSKCGVPRGCISKLKLILRQGRRSCKYLEDIG